MPCDQKEKRMGQSEHNSPNEDLAQRAIGLAVLELLRVGKLEDHRESANENWLGS